jgi:phenolic acid decarboxylase
VISSSQRRKYWQTSEITYRVPSGLISGRWATSIGLSGSRARPRW